MQSTVKPSVNKIRVRIQGQINSLNEVPLCCNRGCRKLYETGEKENEIERLRNKITTTSSMLRKQCIRDNGTTLEIIGAALDRVRGSVNKEGIETIKNLRESSLGPSSLLVFAVWSLIFLAPKTQKMRGFCAFESSNSVVWLSRRSLLDFVIWSLIFLQSTNTNVGGPMTQRKKQKMREFCAFQLCNPVVWLSKRSLLDVVICWYLCFQIRTTIAPKTRRQKQQNARVLCF